MAMKLDEGYDRIVGLDLSTNSIAYSLFIKKELAAHGEIKFTGDTQERLWQASRYSKGLGDILKPDLIAYESAVYIQNKKTVILLAMFYGAVLSGMSSPITPTKAYVPTEWQHHIGNGKLSPKEKSLIKQENPDKSATWYKEAERQFRKKRTIDWATANFGVHPANDNVADAIGVGWTGATK